MGSYVLKIRDIEFECCFLGRTALGMAIKDCGENGEIGCVWLPDYCCDSMVYPFLDLGCRKIKWYHIFIKEGKIKARFEDIKADENDIVMWCDYFQFDKEQYDKVYKWCNGANLIHDITHSLLDYNLDISKDDYTICSVRKWIPVLEGGLYRSKKGNNGKFFDINDNYLDLKNESRLYRDKYRKTGKYADYEAYVTLSDLADHIVRNRYLSRNIEATQYEMIKLVDWEFEYMERKKIYKKICNCWSGIHKYVNNEQPYLFSLPIFADLDKAEKLFVFLKDKKLKCAQFWGDKEKYQTNVLGKKNISIEISEYNSLIMQKLMIGDEL